MKSTYHNQAGLDQDFEIGTLARHRLPVTLLLHLLPGTVLTLFYYLSGPLFAAYGLPPLWGLLLGIPLVIAPLELGLLLLVGKRLTGKLTLRGAVIYTQTLPWRRYLYLVPVTLLACLLLPGLGVGLEPLLRAQWFSWLPTWFSAGLETLADYPVKVQTTTVVLWLVFATLIGPIIEELYFRGFLLPRLPLPRWAAPLANAWLFGSYHFWQPYALLTIVLFTLPLAYVANRTRNVYVGVIVHSMVNLVTFMGLITGVIAR